MAVPAQTTYAYIREFQGFITTQVPLQTEGYAEEQVKRILYSTKEKCFIAETTDNFPKYSKAWYNQYQYQGNGTPYENTIYILNDGRALSAYTYTGETKLKAITNARRITFNELDSIPGDNIAYDKTTTDYIIIGNGIAPTFEGYVKILSDSANTYITQLLTTTHEVRNGAIVESTQPEVNMFYRSKLTNTTGGYYDSTGRVPNNGTWSQWYMVNEQHFAKLTDLNDITQRVTAIETKNQQQDQVLLTTTLTANEAKTKNEQQDTQIAALSTKATQLQNTLNSNITQTNNRLDDIEQDITNKSAKDQQQDGDIEALKTDVTAADNKAEQAQTLATQLQNTINALVASINEGISGGEEPGTIGTINSNINKLLGDIRLLREQDVHTQKAIVDLYRRDRLKHDRLTKQSDTDEAQDSRIHRCAVEIRNIKTKLPKIDNAATKEEVQRAIDKYYELKTILTSVRTQLDTMQNLILSNEQRIQTIENKQP